ncbi:MAG: alpha/beta fold hydrolase [Gammaproteobacteria bacterium]|nr:alpha/beta fold hydrolase [Gammaproteobacteria bacterium]
MKPETFVHAAAGINWYCERRGKGPHIVLVPSGEGDCASFEAVAAALADTFTVLTFDAPGFSRSSAPADPAQISVGTLGDQVAALMRSLGIGRAAFYGCSSGGSAVLDLAVRHADLVRKAIVHEVATGVRGGPLGDLVALDDARVVQACQHIFGNVMNEDPVAWNNVGAEYHQRLERNYVTWVRRYVATIDSGLQIDAAALVGRPIAWTIGGLNPVAAFFTNINIAFEARIPLGLLMCRHFPQVSIPTELANHIRAQSIEKS